MTLWTASNVGRAILTRITTLEGGQVTGGTVATQAYVTTRLTSYAALSGAAFTGSVSVANTLSLDATYAFGTTAGNPILQFDTNDYYKYDRSANMLYLRIGGSDLYTFNSSGVATVGDGNFGFSFNGGAPYVAFDSGDYLGYDRTANAFNFVINGTVQAAIGQTFLDIAGDVNMGLAKVGSNLAVRFDANDMISFDRASNTYSLNIANTPYLTVSSSLTAVTALQVGDAAFTVGIVSGQSRVTFDPGDYLSYDRSTNTYYFVVGGGTAFSIGTGLVYISLSALPTYADNAAATAGGLGAGGVYRTSTGQLMVRY